MFVRRISVLWLAVLLFLCGENPSPANAEGNVPLQVQKTGIITGSEDGPKQLLLRGAEHFEVKWSFQRPNSFWSNLVKDDHDVFYVTSEEGILYAFSKTGEKKWEYPLGRDWIADVALGKDGLVYALASNHMDYQTEKGYIYAFDRNGKPQWTMELPAFYCYYPDLFDVDKEGNLYLLTDRGITAATKNGDLIWSNKEMVKFEMDLTLDSNVTMIKEANGRVVVQTKEGTYALDQKGNVIWKKSDIPYLSRLLVGPNGYLYAFTSNGVRVFNGADGALVNNPPLDAATLDQLGIPHDGEGHYYDFVGDGIGKIDMSGKVIWSYLRPKGQTGRIALGISSDAEGNVYFADSGGSYYSLDKNGKERFILIRNEKWYKGLDVGVSKDGTLICVAEDMGIVAVGPKQ